MARMHFWKTLSFAALALACACVHARADSEEYEDEPVLAAASLAPPALLSGPDYRVDSKAKVGGYMARFWIQTPDGPLNADSAQLLAIRINEISAMITLDKASRSESFAHALAARGKKTGMAIAHVFMHPVDSITGIPMGVARYFKHQWDLWSGRAQSASDRSSRIFENKGDPFRPPEGPMVAGRGVPNERVDPPDDAYTSVDPQGAPRSRAWYARTSSEVGREAKRLLKYNQSRNEIAKHLGIDPNTSNPYILDRLDSLAWAAVGGNFSAGEAIGVIAGPAATLISDSQLIDDYVLTHTPEQVRERNEKHLQSLCSDEFTIRQFLRRGGFNDTLRTSLTNLLIKLDPREGCNELIELAATTGREVEARYLVDALALIARHGRARNSKLVVVGAAIVYAMPNSHIVLPMPVDYLSWNRDMGEFFDRPEFAHATDKLLLIGGEASPLARRKLAEHGWRVVLRAPYDGAPKYPSGEFSAAR